MASISPPRTGVAVEDDEKNALGNGSGGTLVNCREEDALLPPRERAHHAHNCHSSVHEDYDKKLFQFFLFICFSTACRSFEAGIVSSLMSEIQGDLGLDYTTEGTISASPDYGIAPGALLSILVFRRFTAYQILLVVLWGAGIVAAVVLPLSLHVFSTTFGKTSSLVVARALGGFLWAAAATHYPVWIDRKGPPAKKTMWLACTNICLLAGVIAGYIVGGATRTLVAAHKTSVAMTGADGALVVATTPHGDSNVATAKIGWVLLYVLSGVLLILCGIMVVFCFDPELVNVPLQPSPQQAPPLKMEKDSLEHHLEETTATSSYQHGSEDNQEEQENSLYQVIQHLFGSTPFVMAVAITGCISGGIVYALYFVAQVSEARGISPHTTFFLCLLVFVTAPPPGVLFGSLLVQKLGQDGQGYNDHITTFGVSLGSAMVVLVSASVLPLSWKIWKEDGQVPFVVAFWMFAFAGAMAGPPMNGVAVSAVPHASHVASALQFAMANAAKIVVPQIGGFVCNRVELIDGFHATLVVSSLLFVAISVIGLGHAKNKRSNGYAA